MRYKPSLSRQGQTWSKWRCTCQAANSRLCVCVVKTITEINENESMASSHQCIGNCGLSRLQCLRKRKAEMTDDRKIMKGLELRYGSWMQRVKEGQFYFKRASYNTLEFGA